MVGLEFLAQAASLNGSEAMVAIVQQQQIVAKVLAYAGEEFGNVVQIRLGGPVVLRWKTALGRLVTACAFGHAVS